jgi:hypothetical protein
MLQPFEEELDREFRRELAEALEGSGLTARFDCHLPAVLVPLDVLPDGAGYWIGFGLQHYEALTPAQRPTFLTVRFVSEADGDAAPALDIVLTGASARDPYLLARMAGITCTADVERRKTALKPVDPPAVRRPYYVNLGVTDDQVARGEDFGCYDFPNLGSPGRKSAEEREW